MTVVVRVILIAVAWIVIEIGSGYVVHLVPRNWFTRELWLTRGRVWEQDGRLYQRLFRVRTWKDALPDAGDWFEGGIQKRLGNRHDRVLLDELLAETRRAEITHWLPLLFSLSFFLWNPPHIALWMPPVALLGNAPFIIVQRYNRPRIARARRRE